MQKGVTFLLFIGIVLSGILFVPTFSFAQLEQNDVNVTTDPEIPGAFESVTVTLDSYSYDLNQATITWRTEGKTMLSGVGERRFSFQTKALGEIVVIEVTIDIDGEKITKRITTKPGAVDLLWEASDSYTPPFYKGKSLPSSEGIVKIVAQPQFTNNGKNSDSKNIVYNWKRNYNALPQVSGYGKQSLVIKMNYLTNQENITLESSDPKDGSTARSTLLLKTFSPKIIFYERDAILGTKYNVALSGSSSINESDKVIVAEPFFISPKNLLSNDLQFTWTINNNVIPTPDKKNAIVLRKGTESGIATLKVAVESVSKLFLEISKSLTLELR